MSIFGGRIFFHPGRIFFHPLGVYGKVKYFIKGPYSPVRQDMSRLFNDFIFSYFSGLGGPPILSFFFLLVTMNSDYSTNFYCTRTKYLHTLDLTTRPWGGTILGTHFLSSSLRFEIRRRRMKKIDLPEHNNNGS